MKNFVLFSTIFLFHSIISYGQIPKEDELFQLLKAKDSLLFHRAFNKCETQWLDILIADNFEFYHDQSGLTPSKKDFIKVMQEGICRPNNPFSSRRELIENSLEVFPLYHNGEIYGALQKGEHRFFEKGPDGKEQAGSTALFTHLWLHENDHWQLAQVLSYNHH